MNEHVPIEAGKGFERVASPEAVRERFQSEMGYVLGSRGMHELFVAVAEEPRFAIEQQFRDEFGDDGGETISGIEFWREFLITARQEPSVANPSEDIEISYNQEMFVAERINVVLQQYKDQLEVVKREAERESRYAFE